MNVWLLRALERSRGRASALAIVFVVVAIYCGTQGSWTGAVVNAVVALMWACDAWAETEHIRELRTLKGAGLLAADDAWRIDVLERRYGNRSIGKQMGVNQ